MPVVKMGRMAGQFAKPRAADTETRDGVTLPAYRGDIVNGFEFTPEARRPTRERLLQAYHTAASTLNLIRAFTQGGFADLRQVHEWNRGFVANPANARYEEIAREIDRAMRFMAACGADFDALRTVDFYASHEALLLDYERPLTRIDSRTGTPYDVSGALRLDRRAHPPARRRARRLLLARAQPDRRQARPDDDAPTTCSRSSTSSTPTREPGRLTFITRMGAGKVRDALPALVEKVTADRRDRDVGLRPDARQHDRVRRAATRRGASTTSWTRSRASSRCTARWARCPAASTSS